MSIETKLEIIGLWPNDLKPPTFDSLETFGFRMYFSGTAEDFKRVDKLLLARGIEIELRQGRPKSNSDKSQFDYYVYVPTPIREGDQK